MWDYHSGYVHLTGLWKAIGNSKADIVKLVDNSPDLEPVIRRVRGGFLKIQGTWLPYNIARTLASRTCFHIRYALIPLFGPTFPESCLPPSAPGFGQLQLKLSPDNGVKRRRKRSTESVANGIGAGTALGTTAGGSPPAEAGKRLGGYAKAEHEPAAAYNNENAPNKRHQPRRSRSTGNLALAAARQAKKDQQSLLSPPPLPRKIDFWNHETLTSSPADFVEVLQATRFLQQLSAGLPHGRQWDLDEKMGGDFECGGKIWMWDGRAGLDIVGTSPSSTPAAGTIPMHTGGRDEPDKIERAMTPRGGDFFVAQQALPLGLPARDEARHEFVYNARKMNISGLLS
ncbi:uncharacterized protein V1510DRAFT_270291 [Dipodascopsis tothii]|uniref:uncharacterized protein n=1 Tax=Dipodascopsis tothii TaxID=44089 RepID=UPI0034CDC470